MDTVTTFRVNYVCFIKTQRPRGPCPSAQAAGVRAAGPQAQSLILYNRRLHHRDPSPHEVQAAHGLAAPLTSGLLLDKVSFIDRLALLLPNN